jgi:tRNA(fMet)-specific endonuclease VapC
MSPLNKALLDTDTYSEILKAVDPNVTRNATAYRQAQGVLTVSAVTVMEVIRGFQKNQSQQRLQNFGVRQSLEQKVGIAARLATFLTRSWARRFLTGKTFSRAEGAGGRSADMDLITPVTSRRHADRVAK